MSTQLHLTRCCSRPLKRRLSASVSTFNLLHLGKDMNEILLKYWVLCSVVLAAKMWMNSAIQVLARFKNKQFVNPEDARMFGNVLKSRLEVSQVEHPTAERAAFCWRND